MPQQNQITTQCCVCKRIRTQEGKWANPLPIETYQMSHGYCPTCYEDYRKQVRLDVARFQSKRRLTSF